MKRGFAVLLLAMTTLLSPIATSAQEPLVDLTVRISVEWQPLGDDIGDDCRLWDIVPGSANLYTELPQQVVITNQFGEIIAAEPVPVGGEWIGSRDADACQGEFTVSVPQATFYTFTIVEIFTYTESATTLESDDWVFTIAFVEND